MDNPYNELYFRKYLKLKRFLLALIPIFLVGGIFLEVNFGSDKYNLIEFILFILLMVDVGVVIAFLSKKFYNWVCVFLGLLVIGIFLRHQRWPFGGLLFALGFGGLGTTSIFLAKVYLKRYRATPFLRYIGFSFSIVSIIYSFGFLWKLNHLPGANYLLNISVFTFIPFLFAFIFTLPNANFINWVKSERTVFFRAIVIPMLFMFVLTVLTLVFPDVWASITRSSLVPFGMIPVELIK